MTDKAKSLADAQESPSLMPRALLVLALSFIVVMLDGYDLLCMSFVAPPLAGVLHIDVARFGPIFGAGVAGVLIGGLTLGATGDRFGRKAILLASVAIFGLFSLLPVFDLQYDRLLLYRFVTGLGLGGAMPCVAALTAESAPPRFRALFVSLMYGGVPVGGVIGGFLASRLIPQHGWEVAFLIGGIAPLAILPVLGLSIPETVTRTTGSAGAFGRVRALFEDGRSGGTVLLWMAAFFALLSFGGLVSWLPVLMTKYDLPLKAGILGPVVLNLGGIAGTIVVGLLLGRSKAPVVAGSSFVLAGIAMVYLAHRMGPHAPAFALIVVTGLFLLGAINATNSLTANAYPTAIRATAVGWALAAGRTGGIIGPMVGGVLLGRGVSVPNLLQIMAGSAILAGLSLGLFAWATYLKKKGN